PPKTTRKTMRKPIDFRPQNSDGLTARNPQAWRPFPSPGGEGRVRARFLFPLNSPMNTVEHPDNAWEYIPIPQSPLRIQVLLCAPNPTRSDPKNSFIFWAETSVAVSSGK